MNNFFPIIELVDRFCIAELKFYKTKSNTQELEFYKDQLANYDLTLIQTELDGLYDIHNTIWSLESELKSGVEHKLDLAEIGRRAIEIRNWNNKRIILKNTMAKKLNCQVREIKQDHLSQ